MLVLDPGESGKPRLRSQASPPFQAGRLVAAILMLPPPIRARGQTASTLPVLQANNYAVQQIGFSPGSGTEFASPPDLVTTEPNYIEVRNSADSEFINVANRWSRIAEVCRDTTRFPATVADALDRYQEFLASGRPVDAGLARIVNDVRSALAGSAPGYDPALDPLPALEAAAGISPAIQPPLPTPDELSEDETELKARSAVLYRLTLARGPSARQFSRAVREAYRHRCAFCGARLGGVAGVPSGIDAAHILAWSAYDLDVLGNGIALCKTHHWAFDAALMVPAVERGVHLVRFTRLAERFDSATLAILGSDRFLIPEDWLPADPKDRPNAKYLARLYDDLAIDF